MKLVKKKKKQFKFRVEIEDVLQSNLWQLRGFVTRIIFISVVAANGEKKCKKSCQAAVRSAAVASGDGPDASLTYLSSFKGRKNLGDATVSGN
jgi:hypothetical protein